MIKQKNKIVDEKFYLKNVLLNLTDFYLILKIKMNKISFLNKKSLTFAWILFFLLSFQRKISIY